ncbi:hypothetical protein P7K49_010325 [Saguinus oedipus]|uniref:Uncharacterized protein n=1 Tax=Saguinus oedipus TaxID=9490 RepID=A0ABQ9VMH5_SAGOE|nr:hypothetical protein P7K49_010325 [Saguinus oedipus]
MTATPAAHARGPGLPPDVCGARKMAAEPSTGQWLRRRLRAGIARGGGSALRARRRRGRGGSEGRLAPPPATPWAARRTLTPGSSRPRPRGPEGQKGPRPPPPARAPGPKLSRAGRVLDALRLPPLSRLGEGSPPSARGARPALWACLLRSPAAPRPLEAGGGRSCPFSARAAGGGGGAGRALAAQVGVARAELLAEFPLVPTSPPLVRRCPLRCASSYGMEGFAAHLTVHSTPTSLPREQGLV